MADNSIGIMQPYFFPYPGYFSLIAATDKWVFFDTAQYIRHGWVNRNRVLKPNRDDWQYVIVPLEKHDRETPINRIFTIDDDWQKRIIGQLAHYKKKAPFYKQAMDLIDDIIYEHVDRSLSKLNIRSVVKVCQYCSIPIEFQIFSEMNVDLGIIDAPDEWALKITEMLEATHYINPNGGKSFFDPGKYLNAGIKLKFLDYYPIEYNQFNEHFIPGLSIIDCIMHCETSVIREMIFNYRYSDK